MSTVEKIEVDIKSGDLNKLWKNAEKEIEAGEGMLLDEFLHNQKL